MASEQAITSPIPAPAAVPAGALVRARTLLASHAPLVPVLALSATLNCYALSQNGYANNFYSAGVRSMLGSLHNLLFNSFDPGGLIAIDKPPLALWVQVASTKVLGFAPLPLLLPEAIAGTLAVAALYCAMVRPFGRGAALIGALTLAVFPAFVAVSRDNGPDPLLILFMTLACVAALRAIEDGRTRTLVLTAVLVALAFNTKTLAAYLVVPPIALAYMLCARGSMRRRAGRLALAGLVMVALSLAWLLVVDLTPASERPYVGGSLNNSELGLTFAYNGLGRVDGEEGAPGKIPQRSGASVITASESTGAGAQSGPSVAPSLPTLSHGHHTSGVGSSAGETGPLRLLGSELGKQGGWLIPFALASLVALLALLARERREQRLPWRRRLAREDEPAPDAVRARERRLAGVLVLGGWFLLEALVLSFAGGIVHPYYVSALAPGAAAMTGAGAVLFAELARARDRLVLLLVLGLGATVAGQIVLLRRDHYLGWLPVVLVAAFALCLLIVAMRLALPRARSSWSWAIVPMLALLLVAPTAYATTTWLAPVNGPFPAAGPRAPAGPGGVGLEGAQPPVYRGLVAFLASHGATHRFSVLTVDSSSAAPLILMGTNAAALGGYGGTDPAIDGARLADLVARGEARYVLLGGGYSERGGNKATAAVLSACREVPTGAWGGPPLEPYSFVLFDCRGHEAGLRERARRASGS